MPFSRAKSYARMLDARKKDQKKEYARVEIEPSVSNGKYVVISVPADKERRDRIIAAFERDRASRADTKQLAFFADPDDPNLTFCHSGENVYELTIRDGKGVDCSCPDKTKGQARRAGIDCYHMRAWNARILELKP